MAFDMKMVIKGRQIPLRGLVPQLRVHIRVAKEYPTELQGKGFGPERLAEMTALGAVLASQKSRQVESRTDATSSTASEAKKRATAKAFIAELRAAVIDAVADAQEAVAAGKAPGISPEQLAAAATVKVADFNAGQSLGSATAVIEQYMTKTEPHVRKLEPFLLPYFENKPVADRLATLRAELGDADTTQELALANAPAETQALYEAKGKALTLIERMNRAGKRAFQGQAVIVGKFNKDLILRAKRGDVIGEEDAGEGEDGKPVEAGAGG